MGFPRVIRAGRLLRRVVTMAVAGAFALASCLPSPEASSAPAAGLAKSAIRSVQVTDIRDSAFFVSWVSDLAEVGAVQWGAGAGTPGTRVPDLRGDVASTVHLVKVTGLGASSPYAFDVVSGATVDDQGGQHYRVTTGPTLPISASDSIYGRILDGGNGPARHVLVTITVRGADGTAAAPMTTLVGPNDDGYWTSNLGNARAVNGLAWFTGLANARVEVSADGGELGRAAATVELGAARAGISVAKLDGKAPAPVPGVATSTPVIVATPTAPTSGGPDGAAPAVGAPGPSGGAPASTGGATGRPITVAPAPGTNILPALPDGSSLKAPTVLDPGNLRPGFAVPSPGETAPSTSARTGDILGGATHVVATDVAIAPRGITPVDASGVTVVRVAGVGDASLSLDAHALARLAASGVASMAVAFDAEPPLENEVQAGSLGGGVVVPAGRPIDLRLDLRDASGNPVIPSVDGTTVDVTLPVLPIDPGTEGTFAWLVATYDADGFAGYERPPAAFDPATNRTTLALSPAQLQGTLFLPAMVVPATVLTIDPEARMWSSPWADANDFGPAGPALTGLAVVAPQVRGRIYVYNPTTSNYGWIDGDLVGPA